MNLLTSFESDGKTPVYFNTVRQQQDVFRSTLELAQADPIAVVPRELDLNVSIEALLKICNPYRKFGQFSVEEFYIGPRGDSMVESLIGEIEEDKVILSAGDMGTLSGRSGIYEFNLDLNKISYSKTLFEMHS